MEAAVRQGSGLFCSVAGTGKLESEVDVQLKYPFSGKGFFDDTWLAFLGLALMWGTSFLFIKVALETLHPLTLVGFRLLIGWLALGVIIKWRGLVMPASWTIWRPLLILGLVNTALPFVLITWGESGDNGVSSGVASVLNSTVPLFSIFLSGLILRREEVTTGTMFGLFVGFGGVVLLLSRRLGWTWDGLLPPAAIILAAFCYASGSAYARARLRQVGPVVSAFGQLFVADLFVWAAAFLFDDFHGQRLTWSTVGALLWLGVLGSCLAYICYFFILQRRGATRTTLVTYLLPVVGVSAGVMFLGEQADWRLLVGGLLILSGVGAVNWRPRPKISANSD